MGKKTKPAKAKETKDKKELKREELKVVKVSAKARFLRVSPKKVNRVLKHIRGKEMKEALNSLRFLPQAGAGYIEKVLKSAIANAENNHSLKKEDLIVSEAIVGSGVLLKRYRAGSRGSPEKIEKPTAHITITLSNKEIK